MINEQKRKIIGTVSSTSKLFEVACLFIKDYHDIHLLYAEYIFKNN